MRASRCVLFVTRTLILALTSILALALLFSVALAQQSDQAVAERVLGPQWKQLSRRAGMIFAGTVLGTPIRGLTAHTVKTTPAVANRPVPGTTPAVELTFRVDEAIAGVERGQ